MDFWISHGFQDFGLDFWISGWISMTVYEISRVSDPSDVAQQKIEVVSLKQAFPGPEVWQVLFTILTCPGYMV